MQRHQLDSNIGGRRSVRGETSAQGVEIGPPAGIELGLNDLGEFGLASTLMRERQQPDHGAARRPLAVARQQRLEGAPVRAAREELLAVDQIEQGHGFTAQGVDDVPVVDNMAVLAAGMRSTAAHLGCRAEKAFEPIVVEAHSRRWPISARQKKFLRVNPLVEVAVTMVSS